LICPGGLGWKEKLMKPGSRKKYPGGSLALLWQSQVLGPGRDLRSSLNTPNEGKYI